MPVPNPKAGESEREYISRCEKFMHEENESKPEAKTFKRADERYLLFNLAQKQRLKFPASQQIF